MPFQKHLTWNDGRILQPDQRLFYDYSVFKIVP